MSQATAVALGFKELLTPIAAGNRVIVGPLAPDIEGAISLTPYPLEDDSETGTILSALQVRIRGTKTGGTTPVLLLQDAVWDAICLPETLTFAASNTAIIMAWRQMTAPLGLDAQGRPEIADTYYLRSDRLGRSG